jgi:hypothetical protein
VSTLHAVALTGLAVVYAAIVLAFAACLISGKGPK